MKKKEKRRKKKNNLTGNDRIITVEADLLGITPLSSQAQNHINESITALQTLSKSIPFSNLRPAKLSEAKFQEAITNLSLIHI